MNIRIYGGSLTSVALADFLTQNNIFFEWYTLGEKLGGHFSGVAIQEKLYDLGMVLLELAPGQNNPKMYKAANYEASSVKSFLRGEALNSAMVKVLHNRELHSDFVISDDISTIPKHNYHWQPQASSTIHPAQKWEDPLFEERSYEKICSILYPAFYRDYLKNIASKITNDNENQLSCRYHRQAWLPLYYPDTLNHQATELKKYLFHNLKNRTFAEFLSTKITNVLNSKYCKLDDTKVSLLTAEDLKPTRQFKRFIACDMFKLPGVSDVFDSSLFFRPTYDIAVIRSTKPLQDNLDCIFDVQDDYVFRTTVQTQTANSGAMIFIEMKSLQDTEQVVAQRCLNYVETQFNIEQTAMRIELCKVKLNGPLMPTPGAENNILKVKEMILKKFSTENNYFYGLQNGLNSLAMNKQLNHAINHWGPQCL